MMSMALQRLVSHYFINYFLSKKCLMIISISMVFIFIIMRDQLSYLFRHHIICEYFSSNGTTKQLPLRPQQEIQYIFPVVEELPLQKHEKKFPNEQARFVGLPLPKANNISSSVKLIYLATTFFNEFNPRHYYFPHLGSVTFERYSCPQRLCNVTNNPKMAVEAKALIFHVRDLDISSIPADRRSNQLYILYSMEPPWLETLNFQRFEAFFNWTMSYRRNSDVIVKYGFVGRKPVNNNMQSRVLSERRFQNKANKAVWYVSDCCTDSNREGYIAELMQYYPVQVLGGCGIEGCRPAETKKCYKKISRKNKFYLAFENALCQDYVTEKLFNVLQYEIVPVVSGGVNYDTIAPPNSVVNVKDFKGPKELAQYLWIISNNYTLYLSYFEWKIYYRAYLHPWMCDLCQKLHDFDGKLSVKSNLSDWWNENSSCQRWTENRFQPVNNYAFPCYHTTLFHK